MRELEHLLPDLEPPEGGLARLRQRIAVTRERTPPRRRIVWGAAAACVLAAVTAATLPGWMARQHQVAALDAALQQGVSPHPAPAGIAVAHGAALELPSGQPNVKLYLVQTAARAADDNP